MGRDYSTEFGAYLAFTTLARNLRDAAGLCEAFRLGHNNGYDSAGVSEGYASTCPEWAPGCGWGCNVPRLPDDDLRAGEREER